MKIILRLLAGAVFWMFGLLSVGTIWIRIVAPNGVMILIGTITWFLVWNIAKYKVVFPWMGIDWDKHPRTVERMREGAVLLAVALSTVSMIVTFFLINLGAWIISIPFILLAIFGAYFYYLENTKVQSSSSITVMEEEK